MSRRVQDIGSGIVDGVDGFIEEYNKAKDRKRQQKLDEVRPIIDAINSRLEDKTTTLEEKKKLIDQVQNVYKLAGIKIAIPKGQRLSELLLPESVMNQLIETGETVEEDAVNAVDEGQDTSQISLTRIKRPEKQVRRNLSTAEIEQFLRRRAQQGQNEDEIAKQTELLQVENKLKADFLQKNGWIKNPEEVVEEKSGRVWQVYTNPNSPDNTVKFMPLGNYKSERGEPITAPIETTIPLSTHNTRIRGTSGGISTTLKDLIFTVSQEMKLPRDDDRVLDEATRRFEAYRVAKQQSMETTAQAGGQRVTGTVPIQPAEEERIGISKQGQEEEINRRVEQLQIDADKAERVIASAEREILNTNSDIEELKAKKTRLLTEGYEETDKEVVKIEDDIKSLRRELRTQEGKKADAEGERDAARKALEKRQGKASPKYSELIMKAITAFRNNPKNKARTQRMSDDEIYALIQKRLSQ